MLLGAVQIWYHVWKGGGRGGGGGRGVASWKSDITPFENEDFLNIPTNFHFSSLIYSMLPIAYKSRLDLHLSSRQLESSNTYKFYNV